jgi:hypothetical protein
VLVRSPARLAVVILTRCAVAALVVCDVVGVMGMALALGSGCGAAAGAKAGTQCFSTIECAAGLVCIAQGSIRVCSSDLASLEKMEDAGLEAQAGGGGTPPPGIFPTDGSADAVPPVEDAPAPHTAG